MINQYSDFGMYSEQSPYSRVAITVSSSLVTFVGKYAHIVEELLNISFLYKIIDIKYVSIFQLHDSFNSEVVFDLLLDRKTIVHPKINREIIAKKRMDITLGIGPSLDNWRGPNANN